MVEEMLATRGICVTYETVRLTLGSQKIAFFSSARA